MIENGAVGRRRPNLRLIILWPASIVLGAEVFYFASGFPIAFIDSSGIGFLSLAGVFGALGGMIAGVLVGFIQRALLPARAPWTKVWVRATFLGWVIGGSAYWLLAGAAYMIFEEYPKEGLSMGAGIILEAVLVLVAGILIGISQGLFMQGSTGIPNVFWLWLRVTAIGWVIGLSLWVLIAYLGSVISGINYEVFRYLLLPLGGAIAGIIGALAMDKLIPEGDGGVEAMRPRDIG
jgi:hypothetical protein